MSVRQLHDNSGFTLVSTLVAMAIILILATSGFTLYTQQFFSKGRDQDRIQGIGNLKKSLSLFYQQYGHYPPAPTDTGAHYEYGLPGNCASNQYNTADLRMDNSSDYDDAEQNEDGLITVLTKLGLSDEFVDPLASPGLYNSWNCRYVIPKTSADYGGSEAACDADPACLCGTAGCADPTSYKEIQSYYLYCRVENPNDLSRNDGGLGQWNEYFYELFAPSPWICLRGIPDANASGTIYTPPPP